MVRGENASDRFDAGFCGEVVKILKDLQKVLLPDTVIEDGIVGFPQRFDGSEPQEVITSREDLPIVSFELELAVVRRELFLPCVLSFPPGFPAKLMLDAYAKFRPSCSRRTS